MSRHHILPPIVYMPAPPKPKETRRRRGVGYTEGMSEAEESEETSAASSSSKARAATAPPPHDPFAPIDGAERRTPSTTGKLSDDTLKELLLAQEHDQDGAASIGGVAPVAKE